MQIPNTREANNEWIHAPSSRTFPAPWGSLLTTYLTLPFAPVTPLLFFGGFATFKHFCRCFAHSDPLGTSFSISATSNLTRNHRECVL